MNITNHTQLLNYLIEKHGLKSYLEIGIYNPDNNFNKIIAPIKVGTDPGIAPVFKTPVICKVKTDKNQVGDFVDYYEINNKESDVFFEREMKPRRGFDLIFIDGLHHAEQVERDFNNSLACLNDGGYIVIHDTLPDEEQYTHVPRETKKWFGDVYKFAMELYKRADLKFTTIDMDCGCTVVWKNIAPFEQKDSIYFDVDWAMYCNNKHLLNIIQPSEIEKYF